MTRERGQQRRGDNKGEGTTEVNGRNGKVNSLSQILVRCKGSLLLSRNPVQTHCRLWQRGENVSLAQQCYLPCSFSNVNKNAELVWLFPQPRLKSLFICLYFNLYTLYDWGVKHRRRIELEDKAKVVTSDWGTESLPR